MRLGWNSQSGLKLTILLPPRLPTCEDYGNMLPYLAVCLETDPMLVIVCTPCPATASELKHHFTPKPPFSEMRVMEEPCSHLGDHQTHSMITFFFHLCRTCKCSERSCSHYEEEMRWKTSSMVALVGPRPECPQVPYLTSSTMEPQGNAPQPSQCPEARCELVENPRSWVSCVIMLPLCFNFPTSAGA